MPGDAIVTGTPGGPWTLSFRLSASDVGTFAVDTTNLLRTPRLTATVETIQISDLGVNEKQQISFNKAPDGGTFTLSFNGATTDPLSYNISAADLQDELVKLDNVGKCFKGLDNAVVTKSGGVWTIEFKGDLRGEGQSLFVVNTQDLYKNGATIDVQTTTQAAGANEQQRVSLPFGVSGGDFTLSFNGETTSAIPFDANDDIVLAALESLSTIGAGNVEVWGAAQGAMDHRIHRNSCRSRSTDNHCQRRQSGRRWRAHGCRRDRKRKCWWRNRRFANHKFR